MGHPCCQGLVAFSHRFPYHIQTLYELSIVHMPLLAKGHMPDPHLCERLLRRSNKHISSHFYPPDNNFMTDFGRLEMVSQRPPSKVVDGVSTNSGILKVGLQQKPPPPDHQVDELPRSK